MALLGRMNRDLVDRYGEHGGRGISEWKDMEFSLGHHPQTVMDHPSRKVRHANGDTGLDGRGESWSEEV